MYNTLSKERASIRNIAGKYRFVAEQYRRTVQLFQTKISNEIGKKRCTVKRRCP